MRKTTFKCCQCGEVKPVQKEGGTGYGCYGKRNRKVCYACCAVLDARRMVKEGRATLYLTKRCGLEPASAVPLPVEWEVGNWPGTLKFNAYVRQGRHNIAGTRYDAWFKGPDGQPWHGVNLGEFSQLCHCKRINS